MIHPVVFVRNKFICCWLYCNKGGVWLGPIRRRSKIGVRLMAFHRHHTTRPATTSHPSGGELPRCDLGLASEDDLCYSIVSLGCNAGDRCAHTHNTYLVAVFFLLFFCRNGNYSDEEGFFFGVFPYRSRSSGQSQDQMILATITFICRCPIHCNLFPPSSFFDVERFESYRCLVNLSDLSIYFYS